MMWEKDALERYLKLFIKRVEHKGLDNNLIWTWQRDLVHLQMHKKEECIENFKQMNLTDNELQILSDNWEKLNTYEQRKTL